MPVVREVLSAVPTSSVDIDIVSGPNMVSKTSLKSPMFAKVYLLLKLYSFSLHMKISADNEANGFFVQFLKKSSGF
jgi:hypothetical protein